MTARRDRLLIVLALATAAAVGPAAPAIAQPVAAESQDDITVTAPTRRMVREPGAPLSSAAELITLSSLVRHSDLDLSTPGGVKELRSRIERAANQICRRLDVLAPGTPDVTGCVLEAVRNARTQSQAVIAAAYQKKGLTPPE